MDCASEEQLVRMKLDGMEGVERLSFDLKHRTLHVFHTGDVRPIAAAIDALQLQSKLMATEQSDVSASHGDSDEQQRNLLIKVLLINALLFVLEAVMGFVSNSIGLVADSLDMLADAIVYGLSLYAVGGVVARKKNIAKVSGYFQFALAIFGFVEVIRRFVGFGEMPDFQIMILVSVFALGGNLASAYLLNKSKSDDAHMKASVIFTSNDVLANIGIILAGVLVYFTDSRLPDLVIGTLIFLLVARGARRILQLAK